MNDVNQDTETTVKPPAEPIITYRMVPSPNEGMAPLFAAKAKARLGFKPIIKNREVEVQTKQGGAYKFEYATLDSVRSSCDEALAAVGLDIFHLTCSGLDGRELHTFLTHESGAYIQAVLLIPAVDSWQAFGSAITYGERYSYVALAGVASEHDDDGNAADGNTIKNSQQRDRSKPAEPPRKTTGKVPNGSAVQTSKPSEEAPSKPQEAPAPEKPAEPRVEEKPAAAGQSAPAATKAKMNPDQLKRVGGIFKNPEKPWTTPQVRLVVSSLFNCIANDVTEEQGDQLIQILELALAAGYDQEGTINMVREFSVPEQPNPEAVLAALKAEGDAFGGQS